MKNALPAFALLAAAACAGGQDPVENTADQLDAAAGQSDPAAAEVLENAAAEVREQNSTAPADNAIEDAADAMGPESQPVQRLEDVANTPESAPE